MNKVITLRIDKETEELLEQIKNEYKITKSNIIRMAIVQFKKYIDKTNN